MPDEDDLDERVEELVEERLEERLAEEREKIREEIRQEIQKNTKDGSIEFDDDEGVSRRNFLKKLGAGAIGLGALGLSPVAGGWINLANPSGVDADTIDGSDFYVQATQPSNPSINDVWIDTS